MVQYIGLNAKHSTLAASEAEVELVSSLASPHRPGIDPPVHRVSVLYQQHS